jgi:hypothetical protein
MDTTSEIRLDKSKVTHIVIRDKFKGIDNGRGVKQYKFCEAVYIQILRWKFFNLKEGYYRDGRQSESAISPYYTKQEIEEDSGYLVDAGWVYTKVKVSIFVQDKLIKKLFFLDLESAKSYCDVNFENVDFVI